MKKFILVFVIFAISVIGFSDTFVVAPFVISGTKVIAGESFHEKEIIPADILETSSEFADVFFNSNVFDFVNHGSTGSLLNVNVDGVSSRQTLVTIDGIKLNDVANGEFDLSIIEPELLSSVTGIRNNASPMYGANASGGVLELKGINFSQDKIGFNFGSHNYKKVFYKKMLDEKTSFFISNKEFNGNIPDSSGRQSTFYVKNQNEKNSISMLFADRRQYTPGSISFPAPGEYTDSKLSVISFNSKITDNIYFKAGNTKNNTDNFNLAANKTNPVDNENSIYEISYRNENLAFGISKESQKAYIESPWGGKYDEKRDIDSIFLEYIIGKSVYFNLRQDKYNDFKDEDSFNITYKLSDNLKAGYGEGYSLPTFNQLYWPGFSNPALKAEYSEVYSLNYENKDLSFFVFNNKYNDLMQYDPLLFKTLNIAKAEIKGFETKYKINDEIELFYKHQNPQNKTNKSKLNYRQLNKAGISYKKDNCNLYVNHIGKRYNNGKEFPQTTVINLKLNFDKSFISIVNLFDKEYTIQDDYEKACREFSFGFEISI